MPPREYPMKVWMKDYVLRTLSVNNQIATKATDDVIECAEMVEPFSLNEYGAGILLPLAHAMITKWKGRGSISAFCFASKQFGIQSLEHITWLQVNGLDSGYIDVLRDTLGEAYSTSMERAGLSIWMACTAAYDVLYEFLPRDSDFVPIQEMKKIHLTSQEVRVVGFAVHNAKFLVKNIRGDNYGYKGAFLYMTDTTINHIHDECQGIVKDFGNVLSRISANS